MLSKLSKAIANILVNEAIIDEDDFDLYEYGLFYSFSYIYFFIITFINGIFFHAIIESVVFYLSFTSIRQFAGGFHSEKESTCLITTFLLSLSGVLFTKLTTPLITNWHITLFAIIVVSIITILLSPIDNQSNPLTDKEKQKFKRKTLITLVILLFFAFCCILLKLYGFSLAILFSLLLELFLLIIGKIKYQYLK